MKILNSEQMYHEAAQSKTKQTAEQQKIELKKTQFVSQTVTQTELASSSNYHQFREMQEIFFNCSINANPQAHLVLWFFNGKALQTDLSKGRFGLGALAKVPLGDGSHFSARPHNALLSLFLT